MKKMLKVLSILELVIGILSLVVGIATLALGGFMDSAVNLPAEQQALVSMKVSAVLGLISGVFNLGCGFFGLKGANGDQGKLSTAVKLGWIGLIAALVSGVLALAGDTTIDRVITAVCSSVVPVLFLISAKSMKNDSDKKGY